MNNLTARFLAVFSPDDPYQFEMLVSSTHLAYHSCATRPY